MVADHEQAGPARLDWISLSDKYQSLPQVIFRNLYVYIHAHSSD